jgi:curved DNA-binding protein CbpA
VNDPYKILGVPRDADRSTIQAAYRRLAWQHHPDLGGDQSVMATINEAWHVVGRSEARTSYDVGRSSPPNGPTAPIARAAARRAKAARTGTTLDFGRYAGWQLTDIAHQDPDYLEWLVRTPIGRGLRTEIDAALAPRRAASAAESTNGRPNRSRRGWRR